MGMFLLPQSCIDRAMPDRHVVAASVVHLSTIDRVMHDVLS